MGIYRMALALAASVCAGDAIAQSTNCMSMGGGMVHCDSIGSNGSASSSDCMSMGGGMTHCNTMDRSQSQQADQPHTDGSTLSFIGNLVAQSNERALTKRLGEMIAKGDCVGAAKLAYSKGRLDLGRRMNSVCSPEQSAGATPRATADQTTANQATSQANLPATSPLTSTLPELEGRLRLVAARANAATPTPLNDITTATKVEAVGTQILISASVNAPDATLTDANRSSITNQICANPSSPELLKAGASIRIKYVNGSGHDVGSVMVTRAECGL